LAYYKAYFKKISFRKIQPYPFTVIVSVVSLATTKTKSLI